jgi:DNA-binding transcriptional LysR family regulator
MPRHLDLVSLRSLVTVADLGGVTRAAGVLNLTQSAVSMQIRRLEAQLGATLFARTGARMVPTPACEALLPAARRMLSLNDEALARFASETHSRKLLRLGVPYDIVASQMPGVLRAMATARPECRVDLTTSYSRQLRAGFEAGAYDIVLTTEETPGPGAEVLGRRLLHWVGATASGGAAALRPLPVAFKPDCAFRAPALAALEAAGIDWVAVPDGGSETVIETTVAAGLGLTVRMEGNIPLGCVAVGEAAGLPSPGETFVCLYHRVSGDASADLLIGMLAAAYAGAPASPVDAAPVRSPPASGSRVHRTAEPR